MNACLVTTPLWQAKPKRIFAGKAQELGLVMDGSPLVRFIIDDELKHGKFDVVAELVSAPIVSQLRAEEMQRYGLSAQDAGAPIPANIPTPQSYGQQQAYAPVQKAPAQAQQFASSGIDVMAEDALAMENAADAYDAAPVAHHRHRCRSANPFALMSSMPLKPFRSAPLISSPVLSTSPQTVLSPSLRRRS